MVIKTAVFLILLVFISGCSPAEISDTAKTGMILKDEVWSGTIHITGDIWVPKWVTLTIKPGTKILIKANSDDQNAGGEHIQDEITSEDPSSKREYTESHINIGISGTLTAVGTPEEKIIFTSDSSNPYNTDWDGITFDSGSSGEMKYCIVEYTHTGPALHGTDDVTISHCEIRHTFWGGLHAFENSPVFEYNVLDDIGHEAFDTHKASPIIRYNNISHTRSAVVFNNHAGKPLIFENNIIKNSSNLAMLQENAYAVIKDNKFIGSDDTGGPWEYKGFTLNNSEHSQGISLADNVNVEIINNEFIDIHNPVSYQIVGPNKGIGHTTNNPEPFEINAPEKIFVKNNTFDSNGDDDAKPDFSELSKWENVVIEDNK